MLPKRFKRALLKACIHLLQYDERHLRLLNVFDTWPFVERRRQAILAYWVGGDRRGASEPVLTRGLMRTIIICVTLVLATSLGYAAWGMVEGLILVPVFIAYVFFVLFSRSLALKVMELLA